MLFKQEKMIRCVSRWTIHRMPLPKFWFWIRHQKSNNWWKLANNNSWIRREIKFIGFDRSWSFERPRFFLKSRHMGFCYSNRKKFVPSHCCLWFASQTTRKCLKRIFAGDEQLVIYNNVNYNKFLYKNVERFKTLQKPIHQKRWSV